MNNKLKEQQAFVDKIFIFSKIKFQRMYNNQQMNNVQQLANEQYTIQ